MATVYDHLSYKDPAWAEHNRVITRVSKAQTITTGATTIDLSVNSYLRVFKLPVGAKILGWRAYYPDMDTHTTYTCEVQLQVTNVDSSGTATVNKTLHEAAPTGLAAAWLSPDSATYGINSQDTTEDDWFGYVVPADNFCVAMKVTAAAATAATTIAPVFSITYTMDVENGEGISNNA